MTWPIVQMHSTLKMILNCRDRANEVLSVMKTRHDNYMNDRTGAMYFENDTELS